MHQSLTSNLNEARAKIDSAKQTVENDVKLQLEAENYRMLVRKVATEKASEILDKAVSPAVAEFNSVIDRRLTEFDSYLKTQREEIDWNVKKIKSELAILERRAELFELADKAIADGDVEAYRRIVILAESDSKPLEPAALAELFRVVGAYSIGAPRRWMSVHLEPTKVDPAATREEDLAATALLQALNIASQPEARGRIADLLNSKISPQSTEHAAALVDAIKKETHLEVIRRLKLVFSKITGYKDEGYHLDARELLDWWEHNRQQMQKDKV